jgi:hypothetical protein
MSILWTTCPYIGPVEVLLQPGVTGHNNREIAYARPAASAIQFLKGIFQSNPAIKNCIIRSRQICVGQLVQEYHIIVLRSGDIIGTEINIQVEMF